MVHFRSDQNLSRRRKKMDDPIETDDPIDAALWLAEEKIAVFTAHIQIARERLRTLSHLCNQWKLHAEALRYARWKRPCDSAEEDDVPTQPSGEEQESVPPSAVDAHSCASMR